MNVLPAECFDLHPGKRLRRTREYVASLSVEDRRRLKETIQNKLSFPHCAYAIPAWGLMVLPGPGGEEGDPTEEHCDWTPGLGEPSRHFLEFPFYVEQHYPSGHGKRGMWHNMRATIRKVSLPGVQEKDCFACWGLVNLTREHAPREADRRTTTWDTRTLWKVIEVCRPALVIAPPSKAGGARCYERVQRLLQQHDGSRLNQEVSQNPGDKGGKHVWTFHWWDTPWGHCRVGKMYQHPSTL